MRGFAIGMLLAAAGCVHYDDAPWTPDLGGATFGSPISGTYHLGPVNFGGVGMRNSCGPYPDSIRGRLGPYLAIADASAFPDPFSQGQLCDTCALVEDGEGNSVYVRIIGVSETRGSFGDLFLSQEAFDVLESSGGGGRTMTWTFAECANTGPIVLQWADDATAVRTRLWTRNSVVPVFMVATRDDQLQIGFDRSEDGSHQAFDGVGNGGFEIMLFDQRTNAMQTEHFDGFTPGALVETHMQF